MGHPRPLFRLFSVFFKQTSIQFYNKLMWKNVHPVYGTGIRTHDFRIVSLLPLPLDQGSRPWQIIVRSHFLPRFGNEPRNRHPI